MEKRRRKNSAIINITAIQKNNLHLWWKAFGFSTIMGRLPNTEGLKGAILFFFIFVLASRFAATAIFLSFSFGKFKGQTSTGPCHEFGHSVHAFSLTERRSSQSFVGIAIVGSSFGHGALEFLLKTCWSGKSIEDGSSLNNDFVA